MKEPFTILSILLLVTLGVTMGYAYDEVEVTDGGTIIGHVKFVGELPKLTPIKVKKNQDFCGDSVPSEALIVSANGGIKYAIAYLDGITKGKKIDRTKQTLLNQEKCIFGPHVFTMVKGTDLATKNSDPILHNANMEVGGRQMFNFGQPIQNQVIIKRVRKIGLGEVTCDSHTHMKGYLLVFDHPYRAVTGEDGTFTIEDIPPGKYTLNVWHESWNVLGEDKDGRAIYDKPIVLTKEVEVAPKGTVHVNFELK